MKKNILYFLLGTMLLTGCSDDENSPASVIPEKTFSASSGLSLYYNGVEMPGKSVTFSQEGDEAKISTFSSFDLKQLTFLNTDGELPCPGIIPGSPTTVWNVKLSDKDGKWIFSGKDQNEYCTYSYSGTVTKGEMILNISDVLLKNNAISPTAWKPAPISKEEHEGYSSLPIYVDWEIDPLPGVDLDLSPILSSITTLPLIPVANNTAYTSLSEALEEVLKAVSFRQDGNILLTYISTSTGAAQIAQTQPNGLQFTTPEPGILKLYINPLSLFGFILENTSGSTPPEEVNLTGTGLFPTGVPTSGTESSLASMFSSQLAKDIAKNLLANILPNIATGIPISYSLTDNVLDIYIDTPVSLAILKTVIDTVMQDDEAIKSLLEELSENELLAPFVKDLPTFQAFINHLFLNTTKFKIGFAFIPYQ